ncbi:hypothetical protein PCANC_16785 [Puccinia coronata f. sp. avenae]|uniref:Uncharacterized protein n=1 Tax=Puccinia coronata f. sp. avenae TaxID=200324 RepID=A0A2N5UP24_9BASI|nr:hypothetical protein PCASD_10370 [Puccinia coronata f. sp. avenae]PLW39502.1 hypothetical protein PCANC_16785 [Puccinia coronata f. sp. avenae]
MGQPFRKITITAGINRSNTAARAVLEQPCSTGVRTDTVRPKREPTGRTDLSDRSRLVLCNRSQELIGQACPTRRQVLRSDSACPTTGRTRLFEHRSNCQSAPPTDHLTSSSSSSSRPKRPRKMETNGPPPPPAPSSPLLAPPALLPSTAPPPQTWVSTVAGGEAAGTRKCTTRTFASRSGRRVTSSSRWTTCTSPPPVNNLSRPSRYIYLVQRSLAGFNLLAKQLASCYLLAEQLAGCYLLAKQLAGCYLLAKQLAGCYLLAEQLRRAASRLLSSLREASPRS